MRIDMKKVLTERPRYGHSRKYREVRRYENSGDFEDMPHFRGIRRPYKEKYESKEFSDLLGPLKNFLIGCVGRKYDDVWSEICVAVPSGNTVDEHLKGHAKDYVDYDCLVIDDEVYNKPSFGWRRSTGFSLAGSYGLGLYVDPRDGIIYRRKEEAKRSRFDGAKSTSKGWIKHVGNGVWDSIKGYYPNDEPGFSVFYDGKDGEAVKIDGIWYWLLLAAVPAPWFESVFDTKTLETKQVARGGTARDFFWGVTKKHGENYSYGKAQMNSHDLKKHGLKNDPIEKKTWSRNKS